MSFYLVTAAAGAKTLKGGGNAMLVSAGSSADALAIAASQFTGDSNWTDATATLLAEATASTALGLVGWVFTITIFAATPKTFTVTGDATTDTLDEVAAALVVLLNADDDISGAAYDSATQILTIAAGSGTDDLGDLAVSVTAKPPATATNDPQAIPGFVVSVTDEGVATDDLSVTLAADTLVVPAVKAVLKTV